MLESPGKHAVSPIRRQSLHIELADCLRTMIVEGQLPAGSKINERDLCAAFDVSRTPLREALKVLASEGMVAITPNRGARVASLTCAGLIELFPIIGSLEGLAGELACKHITLEELAEIRACHNEMREHFEDRNLPGYFRCNESIHRAIQQASRNNALVELHQNLAGRVRQARFLANQSDARWRQAMEEHENILRALERRDGGLLRELLMSHLQHKLESVLLLLDE